MTKSETIAAETKDAGNTTCGLFNLSPVINVEVSEDWLDYNNHMTEHCYLYLFGLASDTFLLGVGIDKVYIESGRSYFTVETHLRHLDEASLGDSLSSVCRLMNYDAKRLHLFHELYRSGAGSPIATAEQVLIHVDRVLGRSIPAQEDVLERLASIHTQHKNYPNPAGIGRSISLHKV